MQCIIRVIRTRINRELILRFNIAVSLYDFCR